MHWERIGTFTAITVIVAAVVQIPFIMLGLFAMAAGPAGVDRAQSYWPLQAALAGLFMMPVFAVFAYVQRDRFAHHLVAVIMLAWFVQLPLNRLVMDPGPGVDWRLADLATVGLTRSFDAVVMAGNVMIFLAAGSEPAVVANMARHLRPGGVLIAGFQIVPGQLTIERYDEIAGLTGLALAERWSTWDREAWDTRHDYAVSVHRKPTSSPE